MQSNKEYDARGIALYNSDTDDWTLVSPPESSSGGSRGSTSPDTSPERKSPSEIRGALQELPPLPVTHATILTEVKKSNTTSKAQLNDTLPSCSSKDVPTKKQTSGKACSSAKTTLGNSNISERANDADDESDGMTEVNLDENGVATIREKQLIVSAQAEKDTSDEDDRANEEAQESLPMLIKMAETDRPMNQLLNDVLKADKTMAQKFRGCNEKLKKILEKHKDDRRGDESLRFRSREENDRSHLIKNVSLIVCLLYIMSTSILERKISSHDRSSQTQKTPRRLINDTFDFLYSDPSNHAYTELKLLNEELADCIEQENPFMRELAHWRSMNSKELSKYRTITNTRPFKGLVCYESEVKWRKRFNYLKTEFNFDLRKIIRQIKRRLTNDILVSHHPSTPFELVLNQVEYLDHVEQRRKDRALEKLKAENLDLLRRLNNRSSSTESERSGDKSQYKKRKQQQEKDADSRDHSSIKSLIILESENVRLRREVDSLQARLGEKAGTVYIKQSIELEKCERENNALKQFHQDIVDELGKNLRNVALQKTESFTYMATNSKDGDSTNAKLASTRHLFTKLGEEISRLVARNQELEKELVETKMLNTLVSRETRDLIKDVDQTKNQSDESSTNHQRHNYSGIDRILPGYKPHESQLQRIVERLNAVKVHKMEYPEEELLARDLSHAEELNRDWLSKRAILREQLRESSRALERHLSDLKQVPRSLSSSSSSSQSSSSSSSSSSSPSPISDDKHNDGRSQYEHYQDKQSRKRYNDIEHKRLDSLKKLNKPNKSGSTTANYYNQNSHKNCKSHHRRDEL